MSNETSYSAAPPLTSHSFRIADRVECRQANHSDRQRQACGIAEHATVCLLAPLAPRPKRWSSVHIVESPCLIRLHLPHLAWSLPRAGSSLAGTHLSLFNRARRPH